MAIIANRYVRALLNSAQNDKQSEMFETALKNLSTDFENNKELRKFLLNPCISNEIKINTIKEIYKEYCECETFVNFITELLVKDHIDCIQSISQEYTKNINSKKGKLNIKIVVANTLDEKQIQDIVDKFKKMYNANKINYEIELNESVIGGVKVIVGNKIYDYTLKTQLAQLF